MVLFLVEVCLVLTVTLLGAEVFAANAIEEQVNHGCGVQRQHLRDDQAADDGDAQRASQF